jgi:hypothetical protein
MKSVAVVKTQFRREILYEAKSFRISTGKHSCNKRVTIIGEDGRGILKGRGGGTESGVGNIKGCNAYFVLRQDQHV